MISERFVQFCLLLEVSVRKDVESSKTKHLTTSIILISILFFFFLNQNFPKSSNRGKWFSGYNIEPLLVQHQLKISQVPLIGMQQIDQP